MRIQSSITNLFKTAGWEDLPKMGLMPRLWERQDMCSKFLLSYDM